MEPIQSQPSVEKQGFITDLLAGSGKPLRGRDVYQHSRAHYATLYGTSLRSVANWIKHGLLQEPPAPPPLDNPVEFISWWGKFMVHRVPDRIYEAANKVTGSHTPSLQEPSPLPILPDPAVASVIPPSPSSAATGFLASLLRTREEESAAHGRYKAAVEEPDPNEGKIRVTQKNWQDLSEHLRQLEKAAPDVLRRSGDMWLAVDVIRELASIHTVIVNGVRSLGRRFATKTGVEWTVERDRIFAEEVNFIFRSLTESKFSAS